MTGTRFAEVTFLDGTQVQGEVIRLSRHSITVDAQSVSVSSSALQLGDRATVTMTSGGSIYRGAADLVSVDGPAMVLRSVGTTGRSRLRGAPRHPIRIPALVRWRRSGAEWGQWMETTTFDLSVRGVSVMSYSAEDAPCAVEVNLALQPYFADQGAIPENIRMPGRATNVRRTPDGRYLVGIALTLAPPHVLRILRLIETGR